MSTYAELTHHVLAEQPFATHYNSAQMEVYIRCYIAVHPWDIYLEGDFWVGSIFPISAFSALWGDVKVNNTLKADFTVL